MAECSRAVLKVVVAQICQTIGWHSVNSTPLEFMIDLMQEYLLRIARLSNQYAEILGRTDVNLDDVGLAFQHMNIDIHQLAEYVRNVDSVPCAISVPKFPIYRDNHLNFLKPGSREVVTRAVHIHEHLPAMHYDVEDMKTEKEQSIYNEVVDIERHDIGTSEIPLNSSPNQITTENVFKRPGDPLSDNLGATKRAKLSEEGRPLREIHSVMMTTSGFLSPAREGKLPESRTPIQSRTDSPSPGSYPMVPPELKNDKKIKKMIKKGPEERKLDKENKKKNRDKDLFKPDKLSDVKVKKLAGMKELAKLKPLKHGGSKASVIIQPSSTINLPPSQYVTHKDDGMGKIPKNLSPKLKPEKITNQSSCIVDAKDNDVGKLPVEPDKQKLNIFKKISKPRDDKSMDFPELHKFKDSSNVNSPVITIDENEELVTKRHENELEKDEKKAPDTPDVNVRMESECVESQSPSSEMYMFDDMSPPGTPSTPKTPELNVPGIPEHKKKKKDKSSRKKDHSRTDESTQKLKNINDGSELLGRPKTPEALEISTQKDTTLPSTLPFPFFPTFPPAPGLIPHPINHSIYPRFPMPLGRMPINPVIIPPIPPRFIPSITKTDEIFSNKSKIHDRDLATNSLNTMEEIFKPDIVKSFKVHKQDDTKLNLPHVPENTMIRYDQMMMGGGANVQQSSQKLDKAERIDKKSKKHKIERKEKLKKKKEKKDKHKEKIEKNKEKKEKIEKLKEKKERKEKRKDKDKDEKNSEAVPKITLKLPTASPRPTTPDNALMKKITIKPLLKKTEDSIKRESSPELAKISALVTRPPKQKSARPKSETSVKKNDMKEDVIEKLAVEPIVTTVDQSGHQVWICPACGNQDDGSPMIGCDDCDAWYHWVCVGMQVPPATNEDWYCRLCIAKKQELHHDKKKKKRKKKVKISV